MAIKEELSKAAKDLADDRNVSLGFKRAVFDNPEGIDVFITQIEREKIIGICGLRRLSPWSASLFIVIREEFHGKGDWQ